MILVFWMQSFKPTFSLFYFTFIKRLFDSSPVSAIRVMSSTYLRLSIFLLGILIPVYVSSSPEFLMMYCAWSDVTQSCPTLCDPMNCRIQRSSDHGIFQARVLEWVAISFSRGSSWPRDRTQVSSIAGRHFTVWATREAPRDFPGKSTGVGWDCYYVSNVSQKLSLPYLRYYY